MCFNANTSESLVILGIYYYLCKGHDNAITNKKKDSWSSEYILGLLLACAVLPDDELDKEVGLCLECNLYYCCCGLENVEIWRGTGWIMSCTEFVACFFFFFFLGKLFNIEKNVVKFF